MWEADGGVKRSVRWRRAASNVMLGITLGLLSYYALTTLLGWFAQSELRDISADVVTFAAEDPAALGASSGPALNFDGWDVEDRAYWESLGPGEIFGRLVIADIDVDALVLNGVRPGDLRRGPGWIDWSDLPGPTGTCGISGHRTTYGAPFRRVNELAEGATVDLYSPYRHYRYRVTRTLIVRPDQVEVVASTEQPSLTLTACHPLYSAQYRIAVQADLVEVRRIDDGQD